MQTRLKVEQIKAYFNVVETLMKPERHQRQQTGMGQVSAGSSSGVNAAICQLTEPGQTKEWENTPN